MIAVAIPDAMLLLTDEWLAREVLKYALWDSNPG